MLLLFRKLSQVSKKISGKIVSMLLKIDLKKVFDKLEWSLIYRMLLFFKFLPNISKRIMSYVTTTIVVLVNGSKINFFNPNKNIR